MRRTCATCKRPLPEPPADAPQRRFGPFCSERCRMADLGSWLNGSHRIESPMAEEDLDQGPVTEDDPLN